MRVQYREKYFEIKNYLEVYIYPVYKSSARARSERSKPTSAAQAALNDKNSKLRLARILAANFTEDDVKFELTYSDCHLPESDERAAAELRNFIRRVNRRRKKLGLAPCKYITATESGEKKNYVHRERRSATYQRSFSISNIATEAITASYNDGILTLNLPKMLPKESAARKIAVQ